MDPTTHNALLARYFSGEATVAERREIEAWQSASAENAREFAAFQKVWQNAAAQEPQLPNRDQAWQELAEQLDLPRTPQPEQFHPRVVAQPQPRRTVRWSDRYVWAAAAVLLLALAAVISRFLFDTHTMQKVQVAYSERERVELPDGSVVQMNSGSELQFPKRFSGSARRVTLVGEAYFEIQHAPRPFIVATGNAQVEVLGTKFGVWARNGETRVTVREGRVALASQQTPVPLAVVLKANQTSSCRADAAPDEPHAVDAGQLLGWLEGRIVFEQTSLIEVVAELRRVYNVDIQLASPALGSHTITGSFQQKPVTSVLASICLTLNLQYRQQGEKFVISE